MDDDPLFKYEETRLDGAMRWQKRALESEGERDDLKNQILDLGNKARRFTPNDQLKARVAQLESTVSDRDESIDKLIERASGYGRKAIDLETERNRLSGRVAELERENKKLGDELVARVRLQQRCDAAQLEGPEAIRRLIDELMPDQSGKSGSDG